MQNRKKTFHRATEIRFYCRYTNTFLDNKFQDELVQVSNIPYFENLRFLSELDIMETEQ